ncbi:2-methylcitrate dehydratase [Paenibacillus sp. JDR-2]|uniref:2-methylcitrate dehydratase n=1 Tax=Paenibacillus sp. (strain JDR-2) TaxID=324057 RepID=UPI0002E597BB|nr:2-methylcitrate dehydratase [Paenibacillus sp. JDR-2]
MFVFESSVRMSAGELDAIAEMIDTDVNLGLDAQVISYRIQRNAATNEPVVTYKVDDKGVVSEIKEAGQQAEMQLDGVPPVKHQIVEEEAELSRSVVNEFILSGLAPSYSDLEYDFNKIMDRYTNGESYLRIASDLDLSSGRLAELLEEYSRRVAPLAAKWHEWREGQTKAVDEVIEKSLNKPEEQQSSDAKEESQEEEASDQEPQEVSESREDSDDLED